MKLLIIFALLSFFPLSSLSLWADSSCSRIATINFQEVLIDSSSIQKGSGLKHYLEKDSKAKFYLEAYERGTQKRWLSASLGTLGTAMLLGGIFPKDKETQNNLFVGGTTFIAINFFVTRTLEYANESNLIKAIEEYNQRNLPKIYINSNEPRTLPRSLAPPQRWDQSIMELLMSNLQDQIICFNCQKKLDFEAKQSISRQEECPYCYASLHSCKMCLFYDPDSYNECRETQANRILEKEKANFCEYFKLHSCNQPKQNKEDFLAAAQALFKDK